MQIIQGWFFLSLNYGKYEQLQFFQVLIKFLKNFHRQMIHKGIHNIWNKQKLHKVSIIVSISERSTLVLQLTKHH
jgi:hypothetical protein